MKRILNCTASDFKSMKGKELLKSIKASEGRVMLSEIIGTVQPHYPEITNAELAAGFGADLLLLNVFDVFNPVVSGIEVENNNQIISEIKHLTGRPVGINLEPVDPDADLVESVRELPQGRTASEKSLHQAKKLGIDFVCLTGNPKTGVTNTQIEKAIHKAKEILGEDVFIIAGKMHGAGVSNEGGAEIADEQSIAGFVDAGADIILFPSPGTVPGVTLETAQKWIQIAHKKGALTMLTIGTSQEGADKETIRQIALMNKSAGSDIHHIGDAGYYGIAIPENIMSYSIAIRGRRHTYIRMCRSINR
ncbi:DUF7916 family protein [Salinibacillus xinjiangensis]|uniref:Haloacid dehalogenase-like hydrolase n=1 Tax=Salinibacillus xinjiangensis TaxID=1229268 RepID=A0A6G1XA32_9BACI|nr:haloacid dehalogenase-like hydrolase [Salinibacillus xinjiangensis]MRG87765.1 haloacid dehalogenase-like hydrolase [Salinibacillus xinjiangensis]